MEEGSSCFENPYRQSINISSLARLGTAYEPNGTQTQGKGTLNVAATPGARCQSKAMPGTIDGHLLGRADDVRVASSHV